MYQYFVKKIKKQQKKQHYSMVGKYLFCIIWVCLMQSVMGCKRLKINWFNNIYVQGEMFQEDAIAKQIGINNQKLLEDLHSELVAEKATHKFYILTANSMPSGTSFTIQNDEDFRLNVACDAKKEECFVNVRVHGKSSTPFPWIGYNYQSKRETKYAAFCSDQHIKKSFAQDSEDEPPMKPKTLQNQVDTEKNSNSYLLTYFLIALVVILGLGNLLQCVLSMKTAEVKPEPIEHNSVTLSTKHDSTSSASNASILVRDSYYDEHHTCSSKSQSTVHSNEEKKQIPLSEDSNSTLSTNKDEKDESTKESSSIQNE